MKTQVFLPSPRELYETFDSEITQLGGTVAFKHVTDNALFLRAILPESKNVVQNDRIHHGVAVRTQGPQLIVHPYSFREICTNGAIHITNIHSRVIDLGSAFVEAAMVEHQFRAAIQLSASPHAFEANLGDMRETMNEEVRLAIVISSMRGLGLASRMIESIINRFTDQPDRTGFGLMNAITSTARDTSNQEEKWKLESVGGGIVAWLKKPDSVFPYTEPRDSIWSDPVNGSEALEKRYASAC